MITEDDASITKNDDTSLQTLPNFSTHIPKHSHPLSQPSCQSEFWPISCKDSVNFKREYLDEEASYSFKLWRVDSQECALSFCVRVWNGDLGLPV